MSENTNASSNDISELKQRNRKLALRVGGIALGMTAFGFAMVPLYDVFCEITGLNGKVQRQALYEAKDVQASRQVTVGFMTTVDRGLPWTFEAVEHKVVVSPGEKRTVHFRVTNKSQMRIVGQAVPSTTPSQASLFFAKTECFCFENQVLEPGASAEFAMQFFLDAELPGHMHDITLAYTFYNITDKVAAGDHKEQPALAAN